MSSDCRATLDGAGEDAEGPSKPTRPSRTLTYTRVSQNDGNAHRDSFVESALAGREMHAEHMSHEQRSARSALPLSFGVTLLPSSPSSSEEPVLRDLSGSLGVSRPVEFPKRFAAPVDERFGANPYGRLYGSLWHGGARTRRVLAETNRHQPYDLGNLTMTASGGVVISPSGGRKLKMSLMKLIKASLPGLFGSWKLGDLSPYGQVPGCLAGSQNVWVRFVHRHVSSCPQKRVFDQYSFKSFC